MPNESAAEARAPLKWGGRARPKVHVCIVSTSIWPVLSGDRATELVGGAEMRLSVLARALCEAGFRVSVVTLNFGQPDESKVDGIAVFRAHRASEGVPVIRFFHPRITSWWTAMKRADADVYIQSCAGYLTAVVGAFSRLHGRKFVYSCAHDLDVQPDEMWRMFQRRGGWRDCQMYQLGLRLADAIVAQHPRQIEACRRWYRREAVEIPNCYTAPARAAGARNGTVLWVATMRSWKRPELFLDLARSLPHLRFRMVGGAGSGDEAHLYERVRRAAEKLENLEFVGFVPFAEVEAYFDQARVFVNTSDVEGFPNTFLQSWARAVPTISFVDCGAREGGRPIGFVCGDLAEMRQATLRMCENDSDWAQEGRRAQRYFEAKHSVSMAVERYGQLIGHLLATSERR